MLEAQHFGQVFGPLHGLGGVLLRRGDDEVGGGKVDLRRVLYAGGLPARHGVAGDELHPCRAHRLDGLHKAGLHARDVRKDAPGLEEVAVGLEPLDEGSGVQAEDDVVGLTYQIFKIVGLAAADVAVVEGVLQVSLAAVDAVHGKAGFGQFQRILAAQQAQAHDEITFCFIQHTLPPRPAVAGRQRNGASSSARPRRRRWKGAGPPPAPAPSGS